MKIFTYILILIFLTLSNCDVDSYDSICTQTMRIESWDTCGALTIDLREKKFTDIRIKLTENNNEFRDFSYSLVNGFLKLEAETGHLLNCSVILVSYS